MEIAILDDWFDTIKTLPCFEKLSGHNVEIFTDHAQNTDILAQRLCNKDCVVLFRERTQITAELLDQLPNLKLISQRSVYPHIDVEAATQNKVLLCSNQHKGTPSFAASEHTWALIMAAYRQIPEQVQSLQSGNWQMGVGKTLRGRTIGLYGYGRIARQVETYAKAFGMNVIWWSSGEGRKRVKADGKTLAESRDAFFAIPDIVSIHVRLKPTTRAIITGRDLNQMREDSLFVNTSRAGLIKEGALLDALNRGRPQRAAIDVFDQEPISWPNDPLASHPNVIATPHIGFVTEDELETQFSDIFDQIVAYEQGKPIHMINPDVWPNG